MDIELAGDSTSEPLGRDPLATQKPRTESDVWPAGQYLAAYLGLGLLAGLASALLGIGGGVLIVPLLTGFLGVSIRRAVAISIVAVLFVSSVGVALEVQRGTVIPWLLVAFLAAGAQGGVWLGGKIHDRISDRALRYILVVVLAFTAVKMANVGLLGPARGYIVLGDPVHWFAWALLLGALAGLLSVLVGIGGGIVVVPGMALLLADVDFRTIQVVSLAMIIPTSLTGTYVHAHRGNVLWRSVLTLSLPGCAGVLAGVALAHSMPSVWLKEIIFPLFLAIMVIRLSVAKGK